MPTPCCCARCTACSGKGQLPENMSIVLTPTWNAGFPSYLASGTYSLTQGIPPLLASPGLPIDPLSAWYYQGLPSNPQYQVPNYQVVIFVYCIPEQPGLPARVALEIYVFDPAFLPFYAYSRSSEGTPQDFSDVASCTPVLVTWYLRENFSTGMVGWNATMTL